MNNKFNPNLRFTISTKEWNYSIYLAKIILCFLLFMALLSFIISRLNIQDPKWVAIISILLFRIMNKIPANLNLTFIYDQNEIIDIKGNNIPVILNTILHVELNA